MHRDETSRSPHLKEEWASRLSQLVRKELRESIALKAASESSLLSHFAKTAPSQIYGSQDHTRNNACSMMLHSHLTSMPRRVAPGTPIENHLDGIAKTRKALATMYSTLAASIEVEESEIRAVCKDMTNESSTYTATAVALTYRGPGQDEENQSNIHRSPVAHHPPVLQAQCLAPDLPSACPEAFRQPPEPLPGARSLGTREGRCDDGTREGRCDDDTSQIDALNRLKWRLARRQCREWATHAGTQLASHSDASCTSNIALSPPPPTPPPILRDRLISLLGIVVEKKHPPFSPPIHGTGTTTGVSKFPWSLQDRDKCSSCVAAMLGQSSAITVKTSAGQGVTPAEIRDVCRLIERVVNISSSFAFMAPLEKESDLSRGHSPNTDTSGSGFCDPIPTVGDTVKQVQKPPEYVSRAIRAASAAINLPTIALERRASKLRASMPHHSLGSVLGEMLCRCLEVVVNASVAACSWTYRQQQRFANDSANSTTALQMDSTTAPQANVARRSPPAQLVAWKAEREQSKAASREARLDAANSRRRADKYRVLARQKALHRVLREDQHLNDRIKGWHAREPPLPPGRARPSPIKPPSVYELRQRSENALRTARLRRDATSRRDQAVEAARLRSQGLVVRPPPKNGDSGDLLEESGMHRSPRQVPSKLGFTVVSPKPTARAVRSRGRLLRPTVAMRTKAVSPMDLRAHLDSVTRSATHQRRIPSSAGALMSERRAQGMHGRLDYTRGACTKRGTASWLL